MEYATRFGSVAAAHSADACPRRLSVRCPGKTTESLDDIERCQRTDSGCRLMSFCVVPEVGQAIKSGAIRSPLTRLTDAQKSP
jgi:hypothetical protein